MPRKPEKPVESEEQVDFDGDNDAEETVEEEVEYEEVEEEVEEEEEDDEVEEEEEVEEEVEEEEEEASGEERITAAGAAEDVEKKHAKLLALPPHGSEVYLGGIPHDASEDDLKGFCESVGEVTEVRIMKDKGYAFVTFRTKELANQAIKELNSAELKGRKLRCSTAQAKKHKLFIGNIPKNWCKEAIEKAVTKIGPGVSAVELLKDPHNSSRNRGFVFIEYYNHACAEYSREKMSSPKFKLDGNVPTVNWADSKNAESSASSQVKAVYVKNLPKNISQDQLKNLLKHHGKITKVVLPPAKVGQENSRFGFVHFAERSSAMKVVEDNEKYQIDGQVLDCSLAKPQADQRSSGAPISQKAALLPSHQPRIGVYGSVGGPYGAPNAGYGGAGFGQPLIYGRGPAPGGMAMMPMLLPDGRIAYVLQQPGVHPHTPPPPQQRGGRTGGRGSSSGGRRGSDSGGRRGGSDSGRGRSRYSPY